jgi:hypothetical protein
VDWTQYVKIHFEFDGALVMYLEVLRRYNLIEEYKFGEIHHLVKFRVGWTQYVKYHFEFDCALEMYIEALQRQS